MTQPDHPSPVQHYAARATHFRQRAKVVQQRIQRLSNARLLLFLLTLVALFLVRHTLPLFWLTALVAAGVFIFLVIRHRAARAELRALHARIELCKVGISRCRREWDLIPVTLHDTGDADHPYARDLDLFGRPALTQLLGTVYTLHGKRALRHWLLAGAAQEIVDARQHAVRILARDIDFREALAVAGQRTVGRGQEQLDQFISWVADAKLAPPAPAALWFARVIPIMTVVLVIAHAAGVVDRAWWLLPLALSTIFTSFTLRRIYHTFDAAFTRDPAPLSYTHVFEVAQQMPADGFALEQIKDRLHTSGQPAAARIKRLEQIMLYADVRHSGTASFLLEIFFQWSFHIWIALRSWHEDVRADVPAWFEALGELEALCSLAALSHDQPDWCFPDL
ncbi:MAG TPA: hypothetical protein VFO52_11185, partial [Longimicrobiales bacterium]|nr:hypothetical protein [Longimicrobiales bacterium]